MSTNYFTEIQKTTRKKEKGDLSFQATGSGEMRAVVAVALKQSNVMPNAIGLWGARAPFRVIIDVRAQQLPWHGQLQTTGEGAWLRSRNTFRSLEDKNVLLELRSEIGSDPSSKTLYSNRETRWQGQRRLTSLPILFQNQGFDFMSPLMEC